MLAARSLSVSRIQLSDLDIEDDEIAKGGDANVYRGLLSLNGKPPSVQVAIKRIRVRLYGEATRIMGEKRARKIARELRIWSSLQVTSNPHPHILPLLGVIDSPNGLLDFVSEYCTNSLASYLQDYENKPRRIELMIGTLRGLAHMHELSIVHGDLKSANVLITDGGIAKICDFGHSRYVGEDFRDQFSSSDTSSNFQATVRYMSPEFFRGNKTKPTVFSDIWAFGCLALEILSQLYPYHTIQSEFLVSTAIRSGTAPSVKPEYPNAAGCLNDTLWSLVKQCWYTIPTHRPTSSALLRSVHELVARGLVNPAAATPERPLLSMNDEVLELPGGVEDYATRSGQLTKEPMIAGQNTSILVYYNEASDTTSRSRTASYVVKYLFLAGSEDDSGGAYHILKNGLRQIIRERISFQHQNLVSIMGIDSSCGRHFGFVLEYCSQGPFTSYKNKMPQDEVLYIKYMTQILSGLQYMHKRVSPVPHGDLTPANILVDRDGSLKLTSISFLRLSLNLPTKERNTLFEDSVFSARYMSPELLQDNAKPTPESDMWAFGNVAFWMFSGLEPYSEYETEHDVASQITKGNLPNHPDQLTDIEDVDNLDDTPVPEDSLWVTNGIWSSILRCWALEAAQRLSATQFLHELENRSEMSERSGVYDSWSIKGVDDLTGRIKKSEIRNYGISLSWSRGVWRGAYDGRGVRTTYVELWCWKTTLSQGFFRFGLDVVVKGVQLTPRYKSTYAARQAIRHEILLLKQIKHESTCSLLGFDQQYMQFHGVPGIVLEYCSNGTLQEYYDRKFDELDTNARKGLLHQAGSAINYLHHSIPQGPIIHGNLSLGTILTDFQGKLKLSNFEFACQYAHADNILEAPVIFAPPLAPFPSRWHAPEFFEGPASSGWPNPTQFTDVWSLGCLVVAIWVNRLPFAEYESPGAISQIASGAKPYSPEHCPSQIWELADQHWTNPLYDRISTTRFLESVQKLTE